MTPAETSRIAAWRRPGAVVWFWAWRLFVAWMAAAPVGRAFAGTGVGRLPDGDGALFQPGGLLLVETLRIGGGVLGAAMRGATTTTMVLGAVGLLPLSALLAALCHSGKLRLSTWTARALEHVPAFALLSGITLVLQALLAMLTTAMLFALDDPLRRFFDERAHELALATLALPAVLAALFFGLAEDVARAHAVRRRSTGWRAWLAALGLLLRRPGAVLIGWFAPALWAIAALGAAELLTRALDVSQPGAARLLGVVVVHQLAALVFAFGRASWLARALVLVDHASGGAPSPADTFEAASVPADPSPAPAA